MENKDIKIIMATNKTKSSTEKRTAPGVYV